MSQNRDVLFAVGIAAIIIIGIGAYLMHGRGHAVSAAAPYGTATDTNSAVLPTGSSTSDASLNADLQSVDSQMASFSADDAAASQSVSDEQNTSAQ